MMKNRQKVVFYTIFIFSLFFSNDILQQPGPKDMNGGAALSVTPGFAKADNSKTEPESPYDVNETPTYFYKIDREEEISKGVYYKKYIFRTAGQYQIAHVIEADISNPDFRVEILKAKNNTSEVQKLNDMINHYDTTSNNLILGGVNGSYWRSYTNQPMGPTIINGEVAELNSFNSWSSAFFDTDGKMHIDNFQTKCTVRRQDGEEYNIVNVNRRKDSLGVCLYNSYVGDRVPYISEVSLKNAFIDAMKDEKYRDMSEKKFDTLEFKKQLKAKQRLRSHDYRAPKIVMKYLGKPGMNKEIQCVVTSYSKGGTIPVPKDGCVLTFGRNIKKNNLPKIGDTLYLKYSTNIMDTVEFANAICGTPRLVRNGRARAEFDEENLKKERFLKGDLRRTAIGTSEDKNKVYFITVEGTQPKERVKGATLKQLAYIVKKTGSYDALNLDGGGSTVMVINDLNVMNLECNDCSRSLAVGIGIARKKITLKSIFDKFN